MKTWTHGAVTLSLLLNLAGIGLVVRAVYLRGGWGYIKSRINGKPLVDPSDVANYVNRETLFEELPATEGSIVFLGDSHVQNCEWSEFFPGALNRGIGGDTSVGVLKRIHTITRLKPRAIFLMIGGNDHIDLGLTPDQTVTNIRAIVSEIGRESPDTLVYLLSMLPERRPVENANALAVNDGMRRMPDGKRVFYIDMYKDFLEGDLLAPQLTADGEHLKGAGYLIWVRKVSPYMANLR
jgi:lysophospholipase L1-like esterase